MLTSSPSARKADGRSWNRSERAIRTGRMNAACAKVAGNSIGSCVKQPVLPEKRAAPLCFRSHPRIFVDEMQSTKSRSGKLFRFAPCNSRTWPLGRAWSYRQLETDSGDGRSPRTIPESRSRPNAGPSDGRSDPNHQNPSTGRPTLREALRNERESLIVSTSSLVFMDFVWRNALSMGSPYTRKINTG
jgi:hypothetical protein